MGKIGDTVTFHTVKGDTAAVVVGHRDGEFDTELAVLVSSTCPSCGSERAITRQAHLRILSGVRSGMCRSCSGTNRHRSKDYAPRFWSRVAIGDPDQCWEWMGTRIWCGYGRIGIHGKGTLAHRVAYELVVAPIPEGMQLDHLCCNKACVNPSHLEPVTNAENVRRAYERRRATAT